MTRKQSRVLVEKGKIGELPYEFIADSEGRHYLGRWVCLANGQTGGSSAQCASTTEAILAAKTNAGTYHGHTFGHEIPESST